MMKRAGQLFDVLLAVLVVCKVFAIACTSEKSPNNSQEGSLNSQSQSVETPQQKPLEAIPLEKVKNL
jgi:hypothetical protein